MSHSPLFFQDISLAFPQKICFERLTTHVHSGSRIALVGQNGSGKSSLLKMIRGTLDPTQGTLTCPQDVVMGSVPQIIEDFETESGAERLNKALTQALCSHPNLLLLDEPTNHLDRDNRRSLLRFLESYSGTLIVATHDQELLRRCIKTLWHFEGGRIHIFQGSYDEYMRERHTRRVALEQELGSLKQEQKDSHQALMKEQKRAKTSRARGEKHIEQRKWPTVVSREKARRGVETSGRKSKAIATKKEELTEKLASLRIPEVLTPTFSLACGAMTKRHLLSIQDGAVGYDTPLLKGISLSLKRGERLAIRGRNGTGKTTLLRAIAGEASLVHGGNWDLPKAQDIGVLDQQYATLNPSRTVLETIQECAPMWSHAEVRRHLNDFLFRKNAEVSALTSTLSGGEKARLSFAQIAAYSPPLLLLDEVTNNLDLETREHVIQILQAYPGALLLIAHDEDFLEAIGIDSSYTLEKAPDKHE